MLFKLDMFLQAAQVYAASIMFGYFVRRVDKRFQLERQLGLIEEPQADAVARLEKLFNTASDPEDLDDAARPSTSDSSSSATSSTAGASPGPSPAPGKSKKESPLRKYIEKFDQATLADMTRQVVRLQNCFHLLHCNHIDKMHNAQPAVSSDREAKLTSSSYHT